MIAAEAAHPALDRRQFLKLSAGSAALLSVGALTASLAGCAADAPPAPGYRFLRAGDVALFNALIPAVLGPLWPAEPDAARLATITGIIDATGTALLAPTQKALRQLFDLLDGSLTRRLVAGVSKPWDQASRSEVEAFLERWKTSRIGLLNAGYRGLSKFIIGAWAGTPEGLKAVGYPGPWKPLYEAVNATVAVSALPTAAGG